jgi:hypothetical protein
MCRLGIILCNLESVPLFWQQKYHVWRVIDYFHFRQDDTASARKA